MLARRMWGRLPDTGLAAGACSCINARYSDPPSDGVARMADNALALTRQGDRIVMHDTPL